MTYVLKSLAGEKQAVINRIDNDKIEIKIDNKRITAFTEDLAALLRDVLPEDRAKEFFSEIDERVVEKGKARVVVRANKHIKEGENVTFTIDVTKYLDRVGNPIGVRASASGFIY